MAMVDRIEAGLRTLIAGPKATLTNASKWAEGIARNILEDYLIRRQVSGMYVALSEHWLKRAEDIDFEYVEDWGYGHIEVYIAIEECAREFETALEIEHRASEGLPGVAAYELNFDTAHPKKFNMGDPVKWYEELASMAPKIVKDWVAELDARMAKAKNTDGPYKVTVGNIGEVFEGLNKEEAYKTYKEYIGMSMKKYGRAAGEPVCLWQNGEPKEEHNP